MNSEWQFRLVTHNAKNNVQSKVVWCDSKGCVQCLKSEVIFRKAFILHAVMKMKMLSFKNAPLAQGRF